MVFSNNDEGLINKKLPKELLLRIFSFLDIVTLCRCAQISKAWNILALDGSNWQRIDLFNFQTDVETGPELTCMPIFLCFIRGTPTTAWLAKRCHVCTRDPNQQNPRPLRSRTCELNRCATGLIPWSAVLRVWRF
uniref:F-box domain-containing protein n=1 Tax=Equus asinus TaxID=9793 RepID=A0A9L0K9P5_EQUAS